MRLTAYNVNGSGGTTVSVKKRGGLAPSWKDAQTLAGWLVEVDGAGEISDGDHDDDDGAGSEDN